MDIPSLCLCVKLTYERNTRTRARYLHACNYCCLQTVTRPNYSGPENVSTPDGRIQTGINCYVQTLQLSPSERFALAAGVCLISVVRSKHGREDPRYAAGIRFLFKYILGPTNTAVFGGITRRSSPTPERVEDKKMSGLPR